MAGDPRLPFQRALLPDGYGALLRSGREARGETRRQVASAVGIAPRTLARIERDQQKPLWPTLEILCDHLGVTVTRLAHRWFKDSLDLPTSPTTSPGLGLRSLRQSRGLTLVEVSRRSGVSAATLSRFERGLTVSRRIARRVGDPGWPMEGRDVEIDSEAVAFALDCSSVAALRAACIAAFAACKPASD